MSRLVTRGGAHGRGDHTPGDVLDGFMADPDDNCDELFGFYQSGDVPVKLSEGFPELHVSQATAGLLTASVAVRGHAARPHRARTAPHPGRAGRAAPALPRAAGGLGRWHSSGGT